MLLICTALLAGTFICGYAPSLINASPKIMNLVAIYGAGVIIGSAIVIILPESTSILINAQNEMRNLSTAQAGELTNQSNLDQSNGEIELVD